MLVLGASRKNDGSTSGPLMTMVFSWLFVCQITLVRVNGQRLKEGCYDAEPITCQSRWSTDNNDVNVEEVCRQIIWDILPQNDQFILFQQSEHSSYLNSIDASTDLCDAIRVAYPQCIFCASDIGFFELAKNIAQVTSCANRPSLETVLEDNENYTAFQSPDDIAETCQQLEVAYNTERPLLAGAAMPSTIDLNIRQIQIKHLCPNQCLGGCFDVETFPPTCDPTAYEGIADPTLDVYAICDQLLFYGFYYDTRPQIIMNTSNHIDYLRYFAGNTTFCDQARQSYSHCLWCADSLCFEEPYQPTCDPPPTNDEEDDEEATTTTTTITTTNEDNTTTTTTTTTTNVVNVDANTVCQGIYTYFVDMKFPDDLYNHTKHATNFLMGNNHPFCAQARKLYHQCYWCAPNDVPINFCTTGSHCTLLDNITTIVPGNYSSSTLLITPEEDQDEDDQSTTLTEENCDAIYEEWMTNRIEPYTIQGCYEDLVLASRCAPQFCGIEEAEKFVPEDGYLGADTPAKQKALVWICRVSSFFSFCGACYILQDILKDPKLRKLTYHQLLVAMASFDIVTALSWVMATTPIPKDTAGYIEGAIGNDITCGIQAFFVQLGFTSVFYNISLAAYYVLVVVYSWKEFQLVEMKKHFHILPLILGFGMAFAAIPVYGGTEYGCHMNLLEENDPWANFVFVVFPIATAILGISTCLGMVYMKVRGQATASKKYASGGGKASQLEQAVFWQCVSYGLAFYISWPILFAVYLGNVGADGPYGLSVVIALVTPMQGFNNFCVYIRPKLNKKKKKKKKSGVSSSSMSSTSWMNSSSNPLNRLLQLGRRGTVALGLSGNGEGSQWESTLDPSAAIAQRTSRISLFSRKTPKNERQPSGKGQGTPNAPGAGPNAAAMARWGLQAPAPAPATGPSATAMAQWGLQAPAPAPAASAAAMAQWGLQAPAPAPAPAASAAAMAQWGLQAPAPAPAPTASAAAMAQWGLQAPAPAPAPTTSSAAMAQWGLQSPTPDLGAAKMEDVESTNGDQEEGDLLEDDLVATEIVGHEGKPPDRDSEIEEAKEEKQERSGEDKNASSAATETVGTLEETTTSDGSSENAADAGLHDTNAAHEVPPLPDAQETEGTAVLEDRGRNEDDGMLHSSNELSSLQMPLTPGPIGDSNDTREIISEAVLENKSNNKDQTISSENNFSESALGLGDGEPKQPDGGS